MGYLICEDCGGYYELQEGESPDDFEKTCECGGKLKYVDNLDFSDDSENLEELGKTEETPIISKDVEGLETEKPITEDSFSQNTTDKPTSSSEKNSKAHFCPQCGTKNTQNATFCKKCGYNFKTGTTPSKNISDPPKSQNGIKSSKNKLNQKKVLIPIVVVLLVLVALGGYFLYQNYVNQNRMQQMDANMVQYQAAMAKYWSKSAETEVLTNSTPINYDQIYSNIDTMNANLKEAKSYAETAYQYADGPYKDYINQQIKLDDMLLSENSLWKQRVRICATEEFCSSWGY